MVLKDLQLHAPKVVSLPLETDPLGNEQSDAKRDSTHKFC